MKRNVLLIPHLSLYSHKDFQQDVSHSSHLGQKKKWYFMNIDRPQGEWDRVAELMMINVGERRHPVFRAIETIFRTIISVNQLSIYGAVSDLCDEYSSCQARTGRPVVAEQSDPLFRASRLIDDDTNTFD